MMTSVQTQMKHLAKLVKDAEDALKAATDYADKHGLEFDWDVAYGMGGRYIGHGDENPHATDKYGDPKFGWSSSSANC